MAFVKNVSKQKIFCWDCKKELKLKNNEIKNGKMLIYDNDGEKIEIFKCDQCFARDRTLKYYQPCEVYSRIVGYLRPIQQWNKAKFHEFFERKEYKLLNGKDNLN